MWAVEGLWRMTKKTSRSGSQEPSSKMYNEEAGFAMEFYGKLGKTLVQTETLEAQV